MKKVVRSVLLALAASAMLGGTCWAEVPTPTMGVEISYPILDLQNDKVQEKSIWIFSSGPIVPTPLLDVRYRQEI